MTESKEQNPDDARIVHLVSQEGESFDVSVSVGKLSELVKTLIDNEQDQDEIQEIPLPNIKSLILAKVIEFAQHYKIEPMNEIEKVSCLHCSDFLCSIFECKFYEKFTLTLPCSLCSQPIWRKSYKNGILFLLLLTKKSSSN